MSKSIIINGKFLAQPITGVQRFALEIVKELLYTNITFKVYAPTQATVPLWLSEHVSTFGAKKSVFWEQFDLPAQLNKEDKPLLVNLCNSGPARYFNQVTTIHDVAFLAHPKWFSKAFAIWYKLLIPKVVNRSKHLFTVSDFSKQEMCKYLNLDPKYITVIHNGINKQKNLNSSQKKPFILSVATQNPRKNIGYIIKAFKLAQLNGWELILAGGESKNFKREKNEAIPNIKWVGYQDEDALEKLYNQAALFVSASKYEGFGIPVLEAMQHGCEIALSRIPVYQELFSSNVHFFGLEHPELLAEVMKDVAAKPLKATTHSSTLAQFNYRESAIKMAQVLEQLNA